MKYLKRLIFGILAFTHVATSCLAIFPLAVIFFGLTRANKFMDNIAINWMELLE